MAERIGIGHETYITWEKHSRQPQIMAWPRIIQFLGGYDPYPPPITLGERIEAYRRRTGLTFKRLGHLVGVDQSTLQSWVRGTHPPVRKGTVLRQFLDACHATEKT